jgi:hypothetical protein
LTKERRKPFIENVNEISKGFWKALEAADTATMHAQCDPKCYFVHIGGNCNLDKEMEAFENKVFQPTGIKMNKQEEKISVTLRL